MSKKNFGGSVPQSFDFMSQSSDRNAEGSSKSKIGKLNLSGFVDQQVLGLKISVNDSSGVTIVKAEQYLIEVRLKVKNGQDKCTLII